MRLVNEFEAVIHSMGEHVVSYLGRDNVRAVTIWGDELSGSADISIVLAEDSWAAEERAIDRMVEVREMFLDDIAIDYRFDAEGSGSRVGSTKAAMVQVG